MKKIDLYKKILKVVFVNLFLFFLFTNSFSFSSEAKEIDIGAFCWTLEECVRADGAWDNKATYQGKSCSKNVGNEDTGLCYPSPSSLEINLQVPIPQTEAVAVQYNKYSKYLQINSGQITKTNNFAAYLAVIYTYLIGIIAVVAVTYIGWGGFQWMMAAGSAEKIGQAKDTIQGAIIGLILAFGSYTLLNFINSNLVNFKPIVPPKIKPLYLLDYYCDGLKADVKVYEKGTTTVTKPSETICGVEYLVEGDESRVCIGRQCGAQNGSCIRTPSKQKGECLNPITYCNSLDSLAKVEVANFLKVPADIDPPNLNTVEPVYDTFCQTISNAAKTDFSSNGQCAWWQATGFMTRNAGCYWYTKDFINEEVCSDNQSCDDLNSGTSNVLYREPQGRDFPSCYHDWCNLGCKVGVELTAATTHYYCKNK